MKTLTVTLAMQDDVTPAEAAAALRELAVKVEGLPRLEAGDHTHESSPAQVYTKADVRKWLAETKFRRGH